VEASTKGKAHGARIRGRPNSGREGHGSKRLQLEKKRGDVNLLKSGGGQLAPVRCSKSVQKKPRWEMVPARQTRDWSGVLFTVLNCSG